MAAGWAVHLSISNRMGSVSKNPGMFGERGRVHRIVRSEHKILRNNERDLGKFSLLKRIINSIHIDGLLLYMGRVP